MYRWQANTANWEKCTKGFHDDNDDNDDDSRTLRGCYLRLLFCGINQKVTTNIIVYESCVNMLLIACSRIGNVEDKL